MTIKFLSEIANKYGFTYLEIKVILFLLATLIVGSVIEFSGSDEMFSENDFDLQKSDSIFISKQNENVGDSIINKNKIFDNKQELSEFSKEKEKKKAKNNFGEFQQYDLNTVTESQLIKLSGIGEKVAANIIKHRKEIGKFQSVEQLLEVKGIGRSKLNHLKKFLIIK